MHLNKNKNKNKKKNTNKEEERISYKFSKWIGVLNQ